MLKGVCGCVGCVCEWVSGKSGQMLQRFFCSNLFTQLKGTFCRR